MRSRRRERRCIICGCDASSGYIASIGGLGVCCCETHEDFVSYDRQQKLEAS